MSMTSEGLRITIRGRQKPVTDLGSLADIRRACNRALRRSGLDSSALLRPGKTFAGHKGER